MTDRLTTITADKHEEVVFTTRKELVNDKQKSDYRYIWWFHTPVEPNMMIELNKDVKYLGYYPTKGSRSYWCFLKMKKRCSQLKIEKEIMNQPIAPVPKKIWQRQTPDYQYRRFMKKAFDMRLSEFGDFKTKLRVKRRYAKLYEPIKYQCTSKDFNAEYGKKNPPNFVKRKTY